MDAADDRAQKQNRRRLGMDHEKEAARFLENHGLELLECNFNCRQSEIDLIMRDVSYIVFVEVKYRSSSTMGYPQEAVTPKKAGNIRFAARNWLAMHRYSEETLCRFDVVSILGSEIRWIKDAF